MNTRTEPLLPPQSPDEVLPEEHEPTTKLGKFIGKVEDTVRDKVDGERFIPRVVIDPENEIAAGPIRFSLWVIFVIFGIFGMWAAIAPLDSAAIAPGSVVSESNTKTVQHLEGGIIETILVQEGDVVDSGQPLIRLSETASRARLELLRGQYLASKAAEARLLTERDNIDRIDFPKEVLAAKNDPAIRDIIDSQNRLLEARRKALRGQVDVLGQRVKQLKEEITGLQSQEKSTRSQLHYIEQERQDIAGLVAKGLAQRSRLLALQRAAADLRGQQGEYKAGIARARQGITESRLEMTNIKNQFLNQVVAELRETQDRISDLEERLRASADVLNRILITAPYAGIVKDLRFHTKGGVIQPGEAVMDLVPLNDRRVIEAQVSPQDIDVVHKGLSARVRLSAYKARSVPMLEGKVIHVSADRFVDEFSGQSYFKARVEVDTTALVDLPDDVTLYPGMQAEVFIVTGHRTLLKYLMSPITDSFRRAFSEQ